MANELKACPFCGANGEELGIFRDADAWDSPSRRIQCLTCNVEAPFYPSEDEAIAGWNTRANHAQQDAPTDADIQTLWSQSACGGAGSFPANLIGFARTLLARYAPAQDAERERDDALRTARDTLAYCNRLLSKHAGFEFHGVDKAISKINAAARAQRADKEAS